MQARGVQCLCALTKPIVDFPESYDVKLDTCIKDNYSIFTAHMMILGRKFFFHPKFKADFADRQKVQESTTNVIEEIIKDCKLNSSLAMVNVDKTLVQAVKRQKRAPPRQPQAAVIDNVKPDEQIQSDDHAE